MKLEILFFSAFWLLTFAIVWHTAKYGFIRTLLPYRYNAKLYRAMFVGLLLFFLFVISGTSDSGTADSPEMHIAWQILTAAAIVFFFVARFLMLRPGKSEYERARIYLLFIKENYFIPGICSGRGIELEDSVIAQESLHLFSLAIFKAKKRILKSSSPKMCKDLALAYIGKGSLLRIMLKINRAKKHFSYSLAIIDGLIRDYPKNLGYQALRSRILFKQGELAECQGFKEEAAALYRESLLINMDYDLNPEHRENTGRRIANLDDSISVF